MERADVIAVTSEGAALGADSGLQRREHLTTQWSKAWEEAATVSTVPVMVVLAVFQWELVEVTELLVRVLRRRPFQQDVMVVRGHLQALQSMKWPRQVVRKS
jgi:hypothetical protein